MRWLRRPGMRLALLGVAAYVVFLAANLPAALVGSALERASRGSVALGESQGTAWNGSGVLAVRSGGAWRRVADIEWSCNPLALFVGRVDLKISGSGNDTRLRALASFGAAGASFRDVEMSAPAAAAEPVIAAAAFARPAGRLRLLADSVDIGAASLRGTVTVEWTDAGLGGMQAQRLGDYRLQITGSGDRADLSLATLRGDLRLNAQGEWRASQPRLVQLRGVADVAVERKDLELLMQALGARGAGGTVPFTWSVPIG